MSNFFTNKDKFLKSPKSRELRGVIQREFRKNAVIKDEAKLEELKFGAVRALCNYLIMQAAKKDARFKS